MNGKHILCSLFFLASIISASRAVDTSFHTGTRLRKELFDDYYPDVRPVFNNSDSITIDIRLSLLKIQDVNERSQSLKTNVNVLMSWKDQLLVWNSQEFDGISEIVFPFNRNVWIPDLMVTNAVNKASELGLHEAFVSVHHFGRVVVWTQVVLDTACEIRTKKYPFDVQHCRISFGKFMSDDKVLEIKHMDNKIDTTTYVETAEWSLIENFVTVNVSTVTGVNSVRLKYSEINYNLKLRRRCTSCILDFIAPIFILAILNLLTFLLPCESGEKTSFPVSVFLTLAVFLTIITGSLPESIDGISYLSLFVSFQLGISAIALMCSVFSLRLFHTTETRPLPKPAAALVTMCNLKSRYGIKGSFRRATKGIQEQDGHENDVHLHWKAVSAAVDTMMFYLILICEITITVTFIGLISQ